MLQKYATKSGASQLKDNKLSKNERELESTDSHASF